VAADDVTLCSGEPAEEYERLRLRLTLLPGGQNKCFSCRKETSLGSQGGVGMKTVAK